MNRTCQNIDKQADEYKCEPTLLADRHHVIKMNNYKQMKNKLRLILIVTTILACKLFGQAIIENIHDYTKLVDPMIGTYFPRCNIALWYDSIKSGYKN